MACYKALGDGRWPPVTYSTRNFIDMISVRGSKDTDSGWLPLGMAALDYGTIQDDGTSTEATGSSGVATPTGTTTSTRPPSVNDEPAESDLLLAADMRDIRKIMHNTANFSWLYEHLMQCRSQCADAAEGFAQAQTARNLTAKNLLHMRDAKDKFQRNLRIYEAFGMLMDEDKPDVKLEQLLDDRSSLFAAHAPKYTMRRQMYRSRVDNDLKEGSKISEIMDAEYTGRLTDAHWITKKYCPGMSESWDI